MWRAGATLHCGALAFHCRGLSCCGGTGSRRAGSVVVAHGRSRSAACGIFPDQGSNPCPLHWQADSQPLRHQGSPKSFIFKKYFPRCHALFTSAVIFLILHRPHIWCIAANKSSINFRTPQLYMCCHVTCLLMATTAWFGLELTGRVERVQDLSVSPSNLP